MLIRCLLLLPLLVYVLVPSFGVHCFVSFLVFAIILMGIIDLVALLYLSSWRAVIVIVMWIFLTVASLVNVIVMWIFLTVP